MQVMYRDRDGHLNRNLALEELDFVRTKNGIQKDGRPVAALFQRSGVFVVACQRGHPVPLSKTPVLGAAYREF